MWQYWLVGMVASWGLGWTMERRDWRGAAFYAAVAGLSILAAIGLPTLFENQSPQ